MAKRSIINNFRIKGLCCAPCTPFHKNGDVNTSGIKDYVQHLVDFAVPNAFVNGTTGEGNSLTVEERKETAEAWVNAAKGKLSAVILQVGANNLRETKNLASHAEKIGADAIACVGTAFYKPQTLDDYVAYMKEVAEAAPSTPFILYDIDFFTGIKYSACDFFERAQDSIPTLVGVKHTSPDMVNINNSVKDFPEFQTMLGTDEMYLQGLALGADVTIMNSYMGRVLNRVKQAFDKGDLEEARKQQAYALAVGKIRRKHGLSIPGGSKLIMQLIGMDVGSPRSPLSPITSQQLDNVKADLTKAGFFEWALK